MQIKWLFLILMLTTISIGKLNSQTHIDTINLSETFLEKRHLRYMYNFALNNSFFQYNGKGYDIQTPYYLKKPTTNEVVMILDHIFPLKIIHIELFNRPDVLQELKIINNFEHPASRNSLVSQFDIEFIMTDFQEKEKEKIFRQINQMVFETPNARYAVRFSNIIINGKLIYVGIQNTFPVMYSPKFAFGNFQIYEFEWCESLGWVYPRRVNSELFGLYSFEKGFLGGTIDIPSLECY